MRWTSEGGALVAVCLVLALYKVGHQQFYAVALVLLAVWMTQQARPWPTRLRRSAAIYVTWHAAFAVLYKWTGGFDETLLREGVSGLVNLALTLWLVFEVARQETATAGYLVLGSLAPGMRTALAPTPTAQLSRYTRALRRGPRRLVGSD